jgi:hypothetical protein
LKIKNYSDFICHFEFTLLGLKGKGEERFHATVMMGEKGAYVPPVLHSAPRFIVQIDHEGQKFNRLVDSGADLSVISAINLKNERVKGGQLLPLHKWQGKTVGTLHDNFIVLGEWSGMSTLNGQPVGERFCMVQENMDMPILGLDWLQHYQAQRDWHANELVWRDPRNGLEQRAPIKDVVNMELRLMEKAKFQKNTISQVTISAQGAKKGEVWLIEPSFMTAQGSLRTEYQEVIVEKDGELQ